MNAARYSGRVIILSPLAFLFINKTPLIHVINILEGKNVLLINILESKNVLRINILEYYITKSRQMQAKIRKMQEAGGYRAIHAGSPHR